MTPTEQQILAEPAGPQMDAWVAAHVFGLTVVCTDWPCGTHYDAFMSAASSRTHNRTGDEPRPVYLPAHGRWPPRKLRDVDPNYYARDYVDSAGPELRTLLEAKLNEEVAVVEPVPLYSTDVVAADTVVKKIMSDPNDRLDWVISTAWSNPNQRQEWVAQVWQYVGDGTWYIGAQAVTFQLAVCRAALLVQRGCRRR